MMAMLLAMLSFLVPVSAAAVPAAPAEAAAEIVPAGRAISLQEAYERALGVSEDLAQRSETAAEAWARVDELWSAVQPRLSFKASEFVQDSSSSRDKPELKFTVRQPLFTGLKEFLALRAGKAKGAVAELDLLRAKDLLYLDVARAYLDLLGLHRELGIRAALVDITEDRIRELKDREKIGRSRKSEVLAAESQLAGLIADLEQAKRRELDGQEALRFLTGLSERLVPAPLELSPAGDIDGCITSSRGRGDVEARRRDLEAARDTTEMSRRSRWPVASFDGSYYLKRPETQKDIMWDLTLSAELPLYQGMQTVAQVRQGQARERSAAAALSASLRRAATEVRTAHSDLRAGAAVVAALEKAVELAEANAKAQTEDYRLGLVTNLDVLGALNTLQQARLRLESGRVDLLLSRFRLGVAAGLPGGLKAGEARR
ncbi:MAG: TolC family protein [Elusimicrobia bacterium]|nr:TolC family protein [Elusimicrobiota bacterium]